MKLVLYILACLLLIGIAGWTMLIPTRGSVTATPALPAKWHDQIHGLDENEVVRFVPPPFSQQRMADFGKGWGPANVLGEMFYHIGPRGPQVLHRSYGGGYASVAIFNISDLTWPQLRIYGDIRSIPVKGDWTVRRYATVQRRMHALESILCDLTGRKIIVEQRMVDSKVIVARGSWHFTEDGDYYIHNRNPRPAMVTLYTLPRDPDIGGGGAGTLPELFNVMENATHCKLIDEVEGDRPPSIRWMNDMSMYKARENEAKLDEFLQILSKQTSLQFLKTRRVIPVWYIHEEGAATQPAPR
jgi:hypothetical protein